MIIRGLGAGAVAAIVLSCVCAIGVCAIGVCAIGGCSDDGGDDGGGGGGGDIVVYSATCQQACDKTVTCGASTPSEVPSCVSDCQTEPWPGNAKQCRATTCGLSEAECEVFGIHTCEEACQKLVSCGDTPAAEQDSCVADCKGEPWPGTYIDCRATRCGASEAQCESFDGP